MKVSVCASLTYYYTIDIPDSLCDTDDYGDLIDEAKLVQTCADADPIVFSGIDNNVTNEIISIRAEDSDDEIYYG